MILPYVTIFYLYASRYLACTLCLHFAYFPPYLDPATGCIRVHDYSSGRPISLQIESNRIKPKTICFWTQFEVKLSFQTCPKCWRLIHHFSCLSCFSSCFSPVFLGGSPENEKPAAEAYDWKRVFQPAVRVSGLADGEISATAWKRKRHGKQGHDFEHVHDTPMFIILLQVISIWIMIILNYSWCIFLSIHMHTL